MLGFLALAIVVLGNIGLFVARIGVLDTRSLPQMITCGIAAALGVAQLLRGGARAPKIAAGTAILGSIAFVAALEIATHYEPDRPRGPEVATRFPVEVVMDAVTGATVPLASEAGENGVIVLCFRGFW